MKSLIIRITDNRVGFCKYFNYILNVVEYFRKNNTYPIIALNSNIVYSTNVQEQIDNWNLIFPQRFSFDCQNDVNEIKDIFDPMALCEDFWNNLNILRKTFYDHMKIGNCILDRSKKMFLKHNICSDKCLFLFLRGTDYIDNGMSSIKTIYKMINVAKVIIRNFNLTTVYLITEDNLIREIVKNEIQNSINIISSFSENQNNEIENVISYVSDIYMMSRSKYVIMTETNASLMYNIFRDFPPVFQYKYR